MLNPHQCKGNNKIHLLQGLEISREKHATDVGNYLQESGFVYFVKNENVKGNVRFSMYECIQRIH